MIQKLHREIVHNMRWSNEIGSIDIRLKKFVRIWKYLPKKSKSSDGIINQNSNVILSIENIFQILIHKPVMSQKHSFSAWKNFHWVIFRKMQCMKDSLFITYRRLCCEDGWMWRESDCSEFSLYDNVRIFKKMLN